MAKKQTRRSVSIRGTTYESLKRYCEAHGVSMSEFVEDRIASVLGATVAAPPVKSLPSAGGGQVLKPPSQRLKPSVPNLARSRVPRVAASKLSVDQLHTAARSFTF